MKTPLIEVKKLTKIFGKNVVLNDVDLDIPQNKIFGIIGESGSGKTTLLKALIGFVKPESGTILFEGKEINKNMGAIRERFGFASQDNCFYPKLNIVEN
ncbi:MAG TPA: ATP-binding cassette domain-containing protein, partial [Candidatus Nanoarchaeia archaeon]|nr:ATP-binding cassette domain-containing protein [Candidatus Nanoarchaeia archaeon]